MHFPRDASPTPSGSGPGPAIRNPPLPFRNYNRKTTDQLQAETASSIPANHNTHPVQQQYQTLQAPGQATATTSSTNNQSLSIPALPQTQPQPRYETRLLPNPPKRVRYSLDDVTFQLGKVRVNKAGQARINVIPPPDSGNDGLEKQGGERVVDYYKLYNRSIGWDKHLDHGAFASLPDDLQHSLREAMTTRTVSQRKASERMEREMRVVSTSLPDSVPDAKPKFDIIGAISSSIEILQAVGKHLRPRDIVNLYAISRDFHAMLDTHMRSSVLVWAAHNSRLAMDVFPYQFYIGSTVPDPAGRPRDRAYHDIYARLTATPHLPCQLFHSSSPPPLDSKGGETEVRAVPSFRYLHLLHARTTRVRDIIACLARRGHRLPPGTESTLMKLWLVMDLPTNVDRCTVIKTQSYFTKLDLRRASVFLVKLLMRFNDPLYGPDHPVLMELMLGQKGLTPLWKLLRGKGYTTLTEIVGAKMRYDVRPTLDEMETGLPVLGVPVDEMATGHREGGWGGGRVWEEGWDKGTREHLMRPDELVVRECARRGMEMEEYVDSMAVYGYVDLATAENLAPGEEEVYMSDEELPPELGEEDVGRKKWLVHGGGGNVSFKDGEWDMKAIRKAKWDELSEEVKEAIKEDDKDEQLRSLVWEEETREDASDESDTTVTGLDDEQGWEEQLNDEVEANPNPNFDIKGKGKMAHDDEDYKQEDPFETDSVFGSPPFSPTLSSSSSDISISSDESDIYRSPSRVASSSSMLLLPELDHHNQSSSSRITSFNSVATTTIRTPSYRGSPNLVGIHGGGDMMEVDDMDLDDQEGESSLLAGGSSMTVTPLKWRSPNEWYNDASIYGDDHQEEDEEGYEEGSEGDESEQEDDEDLKAQADDYYSEDELEYDWDAWKEQASVVIQGRDDGSEEEKDEDGEDEEVRQYHRLY